MTKTEMIRVAGGLSTRVWLIVMGLAFVVVGWELQHGALGPGPATWLVRPVMVGAGFSVLLFAWRRGPGLYALSGSLLAVSAAARLIDLVWGVFRHPDEFWVTGALGMSTWVAMGSANLLAWRGSVSVFAVGGEELTAT